MLRLPQVGLGALVCVFDNSPLTRGRNFHVHKDWEQFACCILWPLYLNSCAPFRMEAGVTVSSTNALHIG